jgi:hypothetical protein
MHRDREKMKVNEFLFLDINYMLISLQTQKMKDIRVTAVQK